MSLCCDGTSSQTGVAVFQSLGCLGFRVFSFMHTLVIHQIFLFMCAYLCGTQPAIKGLELRV